MASEYINSIRLEARLTKLRELHLNWPSTAPKICPPAFTFCFILFDHCIQLFFSFLHLCLKGFLTVKKTHEHTHTHIHTHKQIRKKTPSCSGGAVRLYEPMLGWLHVILLQHPTRKSSKCACVARARYRRQGASTWRSLLDDRTGCNLPMRERQREEREG